MSYELSMAAQGDVPAPPEIRPAPHEQVEGYFGHLEKVLIEIGFFTTQNPARLMQRLRRLYARARLETEEVNILRGILSTTTSTMRASNRATSKRIQMFQNIQNIRPDVQKY